jgi:hypothetical protein
MLVRRHLVQLETNKPGDEGCRRRNSRDNFARNLLGGVAVRRVNVIIHCPQIGRSGDVIDMVIGVIVLLELSGSQTVTG